MTALVTTRLLFLVGDSLSVKKFSRVSRAAPLHKSIRLFTRGRHDDGPLTLASLGFRSERETTMMDKKNNLQQIISTVKVPRSKVRGVRSAGVKSVIKRKSLEIEAAPFSAKSFSETTMIDEKNNLQQMISTVKVPRSKVRGVRSAGVKSVIERKSLEIEAAPFSAKSFSETTMMEEKNNLQQIISTVKVPRSKVRGVRSAGVKSVIERKSLDIEAAPFSAKSFSELGLSSLLIERLEREGFTVPTDVQSSAIPTILENHDVVIQSYTGSGKTLAYLLPILSGVGSLNELRNSDKPRKQMDIEAVIVAPSRELGMQIVREVEKLLGPEDKKLVQQLVGGANRTRQEEALRKNKPAIIVGTPGRLAEISAAGKLHTHDCRYLVLDEVDELLSFNYREHMHRILEHVGKRSGSGKSDSKIPTARKAGRQTIMVSATVPFSVVRAARSWGCEPLLVQAKKVVSLDSVTPSGPVNLTGTSSGSTSTMQTPPAVQSLPPALKHYYCVTRLQHKIDTLRRCVHALDAKSVIAFMNHTRQLKDAVFKLEARGMNAIELYGDLGKLARSKTLKKFKSGDVRVLVTNELSARGLDVPECDLVVNLDLPTDSIHYAHRAGRTGRLGRNGSVVTICEEREVFVIRKLQKQLAVPIQSCDFAEGKLLVTEDKKTSDTGRHQESRNE